MQYAHEFSSKKIDLHRIESAWYDRARVRKYEPKQNLSFDVSKLDFLPEWLPFGDQPIFQSLPEKTKQEILTIAWLLYNQSTIDIEYLLVIPFCLELVHNNETFKHSHQWRSLLFQTITDESFHVQLTGEASEITRQHRNLGNFILPESYVIAKMNGKLAKCRNQGEQHIIKLATCVVTEIVIGNHLAVVGKCTHPELQPLTKQTTRTHMMDEYVHEHIFHDILTICYPEFSASEKAFFNETLQEVLRWFYDSKTTVWQTILAKLNIEGFQSMLDGCRQVDKIAEHYNLLPLSKLMQSLGVDVDLFEVIND